MRLQKAIDDAGLDGINIEWEKRKPIPDLWPDVGDETALQKHCVVQEHIVVESQQHDWRHRATCFKRSSVRVGEVECRFPFPKGLEVRTYLDEHLVLHRKRPLGCNWLNGYNNVCASILRCNHDVQQLLGGDSPVKTYYVTKYVAKPQDQFEQKALLQTAAFDRRLRREADMGEMSFYKRAFGRVASVLRNATAHREVSAQLAAHIILNKACASASHDFAAVLLAQVFC